MTKSDFLHHVTTTLEANPDWLPAVIRLTADAVGVCQSALRDRATVASSGVVAALALRDRRGLSHDLQTRLVDLVVTSQPWTVVGLRPDEIEQARKLLDEAEAKHDA